jgi:hypothetical protein
MAIRCVFTSIYDDLFQYFTEPRKTTVHVKPDWGKLRLSGDEIFAGMEQQIHKEIHHQEMFLGIACHSSLDSVAWGFIRDYGIFEHFSHQLIRCGDGMDHPYFPSAPLFHRVHLGGRFKGQNSNDAGDRVTSQPDFQEGP